MLKNKKGNALLIAASVAISATMGIYYFNVLAGINIIEREKITHLYNAYQMAAAIEATLNEASETSDALGNFTVAELYAAKGDFISTSENAGLADGNNQYLSLRKMIADDIISVGLDPTIKRLGESNQGYDIDASGVQFAWLDNAGLPVIDAGCDPLGETCDDVVRGVKVKVNLAGRHIGAFVISGEKHPIDSSFTVGGDTNDEYDVVNNDVWYYLAMFEMDADTSVNGSGSATLGVDAAGLTVLVAQDDILSDDLQHNIVIDHPASVTHHTNQDVGGE